MKQEIDTIKRRYVKPASMTIELRPRGILLTGSAGGMGGRDNYTPDDDNPFGGGGGAKARSVWNEWDQNN